MISLRANAKVNLFLEVRARRPDGFHDIETVFQTIDLADRVDVEPASGQLEVVMRGVGDEVPQEQNLAARAAVALAAEAGRDPKVRIAIDKDIPMAAGLGGGSADAAAVLVALRELWDTDRGSLERVAAAVGSDVPYLLTGGTALARGRGEIISPMADPPAPLWLVVGIGPERLATKDVYAACRPGEDRARGDLNRLMDGLASGSVDEVAAGLRNDLEPAALRLMPQLVPRRRALLDAGAVAAIVSGSGPTLVGLARNEEHAREMAERLRGDFARVLAVASRSSSIERLDS